MKYQRKRHYIDHSLQHHLIIGLLLLEGVLLTATLAWLYGRMDAVVEAQLFRVHQPQARPLFQPLLEQAAWAMAMLLAANSILLLATEAFWTRQVNKLLSGLRPLLTAAGSLDFQSHAETTAKHPVLVQAQAWRQCEAEELAQARLVIQAMDPHWRGMDPDWRTVQAAHLDGLLHLLRQRVERQETQL